MLASYVRSARTVTLDEIGLPQQVELFERVADRLGAAPPVIEAQDVLRDPRGSAGALCARCGIPFDARDAGLAGRAARHRTGSGRRPGTTRSSDRPGFGPPRAEIGLADRSTIG